jgi:hypothetical protein
VAASYKRGIPVNDGSNDIEGETGQPPVSDTPHDEGRRYALHSVRRIRCDPSANYRGVVSIRLKNGMGTEREPSNEAPSFGKKP